MTERKPGGSFWRGYDKGRADAREDCAALREALRKIAEIPCDNNDTGDEENCPALIADPGTGLGRLCPSCEARAALIPEQDD